MAHSSACCVNSREVAGSVARRQPMCAHFGDGNRRVPSRPFGCVLAGLTGDNKARVIIGLQALLRLTISLSMCYLEAKVSCNNIAVLMHVYITCTCTCIYVLIGNTEQPVLPEPMQCRMHGK